MPFAVEELLHGGYKKTNDKNKLVLIIPSIAPVRHDKYLPIPVSPTIKITWKFFEDNDFEEG